MNAAIAPSKSTRPALRPAAVGFDPAEALKVRLVRNPLSEASLGDLGMAARVSGPSRFPPTLLIQPLGAASLRGIDPEPCRSTPPP